MPRALLIVIASLGFVLTASSSLFAQLNAVDWDSLPYTAVSAFETVDANGMTTYPADGFPIRMIGVLLNNPADMLETAANFNAIPFNLGGQWQVFVQSTLANDVGGVAVYMGQNYGNIPPALTFTPGPTPDPSSSFSNAAWNVEVQRVNVDQASGHVFQAGDLVEIDAQGGLFFGGKMNVNNEHSLSPALSFQMRLVQANYGLPTPTPLTLASIWDDGKGAVIFDPTRQTGGERYQGELVTLKNVHLAENQAANWKANGSVTVVDNDGRRLVLELGTNQQFTPANAPTGPFDVTGIFDQESPAGGIVAGDVNTDGVTDIQDITLMANHWLQSGSAVQGDANADGVVDIRDLVLAANNWLGKTPAFTANYELFVTVPNNVVPSAGIATMVPEPSTWALLVCGLTVATAMRERRRRTRR